MKIKNIPSTVNSQNGRVSQYVPGDTQTALVFFYNKLSFESDPSDVYQDQQDEILDFLVIDACSRQSFAFEHVPGALNIPHKQMNLETTALLSKVMQQLSISFNKQENATN